MPLRETYLYLCIRVFVNWYDDRLTPTGRGMEVGSFSFSEMSNRETI